MAAGPSLRVPTAAPLPAPPLPVPASADPVSCFRRSDGSGGDWELTLAGWDGSRLKADSAVGSRGNLSESQVSGELAINDSALWAVTCGLRPDDGTACSRPAGFAGYG